MKILHIIPTLDFDGGPALAVPRLCQELKVLGCTVRLNTWPTIRDILWADVVHLTGVYNATTLPTLLYCRLFKKPLVWSPRGAFMRWSGTRHRWMKAMFEWMCKQIIPSVTRLHYTSHAESKESLDHLWTPFDVIPNGIDCPSVVTHVPSSGHLRLLFLGRFLDPKKGFWNLIEARSLTTQFTTLRYAGPGHDLNLPNDTIYSGNVRQDELGSLFACTDVLVCPSYTENFGNVVGEALAHGVPVLTTKQVPWDLEGHHCGLRVARSEPWQLAWAIDFLGRDRTALRQWGANGRKWIESEFQWSDQAKKMLRVYESLHRF